MAEKRNETLNVVTVGDVAKEPAHTSALTGRGLLFRAEQCDARGRSN
jgi:hypothetical protein